jgi:hypothetical protein
MEVDGTERCANASFSITNPIWIALESIPGLSSEKPAMNRLSHGAIHSSVLMMWRS